MARFLKGHPLDLAVFRVTVFTVLLGSVDLHGSWKWAALPEQARLPPEGWGWVVTAWPPTLGAAQIAYGVCLVACVFGWLGLFTRVASVVATLCAAWLLGLPQLSGQVLHTHHLVWFLAVLACSPCGDALSVDQWLRSRRGEPAPGEALEYGLPLRVAWASVGLLFFFAGYWKLQTGGVDWGGGLLRQIQFKWLETGEPPLLRVDRFPGLLYFGGVFAIAFELGFGALVMWRKTRLVAVLGAFAFHATVRATMGISFSSLWACYVMFLPWAQWLALPPLPSAPTSPRRWLPAGVLGIALLGAQVFTGLAGNEQSWPVACYPTFRNAPSNQLSWIEADQLSVAGDRPGLTLNDLRGPEGPRWWGVGWRLLQNPSPEALRAHYRARRGEPGADVDAIVFFRVTTPLRDDGAVAPVRIPLWQWKLRD